MGNMQDDLKDGERFEKFILEKIQTKYPESIKQEGYFPDYDIDIPEAEMQLECKFDRLSYETGNLAIEYECNGKPSGLTSTKADSWVLGFWYQDAWCYAFIATDVLREVAPHYRSVSGGDNWASKMYLVPVDDIAQIEEIMIYKESE